MVAVTKGDVQRVHERLDDIVKALSEVKTAVQVNVVECQPCRKIVMGNGNLPISDRVAKIETERQVSMRWLAGAIAAASIVVSVIVTVAEAALKYVSG
jgi:hypothetical protein